MIVKQSKNWVSLYPT